PPSASGGDRADGRRTPAAGEPVHDACDHPFACFIASLTPEPGLDAKVVDVCLSRSRRLLEQVAELGRFLGGELAVGEVAGELLDALHSTDIRFCRQSRRASRLRNRSWRVAGKVRPSNAATSDKLCAS